MRVSPKSFLERRKGEERAGEEKREAEEECSAELVELGEWAELARGRVREWERGRVLIRPLEPQQRGSWWAEEFGAESSPRRWERRGCEPLLVLLARGEGEKEDEVEALERLEIEVEIASWSKRRRRLLLLRELLVELSWLLSSRVEAEAEGEVQRRRVLVERSLLGTELQRLVDMDSE